MRYCFAVKLAQNIST